MITTTEHVSCTVVTKLLFIPTGPITETVRSSYQGNSPFNTLFNSVLPIFSLVNCWLVLIHMLGIHIEFCIQLINYSSFLSIRCCSRLSECSCKAHITINVFWSGSESTCTHITVNVMLLSSNSWPRPAPERQVQIFSQHIQWTPFLLAI